MSSLRTFSFALLIAACQAPNTVESLYFDVRDFGAVGDRVTQNADAIQCAVDATLVTTVAVAECGFHHLTRFIE